MDRERFDAIARLVWTTQSRRAALRVLLGVALFGHAPTPTLAKRGRTGKKSSRDNQCYPGTSCIPGPGRNNARCDFSFSTLFRDKNAQGSQLRKSNFRGADLRGANFRGADLGGACLVSANLEGAKLGASVNLGGAIFCNTVMPDGSVDDSGCEKTTACCPVLVQDCPTVDIDCYSTTSQNVCDQPINGFPSVAHCGRGLACCPCDHPDVDYWTDQCNQTYAACEGKCKAVDGGTFLECWSGCFL